MLSCFDTTPPRTGKRRGTEVGSQVVKTVGQCNRYDLQYTLPTVTSCGYCECAL